MEKHEKMKEMIKKNIEIENHEKEKKNRIKHYAIVFVHI